MFGLTGLAAAVTRAAVDATDYKCAERSKEEGEERFRAIADSAKEAIISADSAGMIIGWNRGAREMFGYEEGEALGKPLTVLIPERYRALHLAGMERFKSTGEARLIGRIVELTGLRRGGMEFPIELSLSTWKSGSGEQFFASIIRDVTDRKRAEEDLRGSQARLKLALDAARIGDWELNLETHETRRSLRHDQIFGYDELRPEWSCEIFLEHVHPEDRARVDQAFKESAAAGKDWYFECRIVRKDRSERHIWARGGVYPDADGRPTRMLGMVGDITKHKEAEMARDQSELAMRKAVAELKETQMMLIQAEKLESLGRLSAGIAHEVKNPLNQLLLGTQFLQKAIPTAETTWAEVLTAMHSAILRMDKILLGILEYAMPTDLDLQVQDIHETLDGALLLVGLDLMKNHITVEKSLAEGLPRVALDRTKIEQVLVNLFVNAMHAMPDGGVMAVKIFSENAATGGHEEDAGKNERIGAGGTAVVLEVSDSGHGIPEEKLAKVFDPFFTTKPNGKGTGLGLTVSRKIIELHGGTLQLLNRPECGVTARITFKGHLEREPCVPKPVDTRGQAT